VFVMAARLISTCGKSVDLRIKKRKEYDWRREHKRRRWCNHHVMKGSCRRVKEHLRKIRIICSQSRLRKKKRKAESGRRNQETY